VEPLATAPGWAVVTAWVALVVLSDRSGFDIDQGRAAIRWYVLDSPFMSSTSKQRPNEPCACRSGQKYKNCHGGPIRRWLGDDSRSQMLKRSGRNDRLRDLVNTVVDFLWTIFRVRRVGRLQNKQFSMSSFGMPLEFLYLNRRYLRLTTRALSYELEPIEYPLR
jgi:hypothetical protein